MAKVQRISYYDVMKKGSLQQKKVYLGEMVRQRWNWDNPTLQINSTASSEVQETVKNTFHMERVIKSVNLKKIKRV